LLSCIKFQRLGHWILVDILRKDGLKFLKYFLFCDSHGFGEESSVPFACPQNHLEFLLLETMPLRKPINVWVWTPIEQPNSL
jgi:hypothetical protein